MDLRESLNDKVSKYMSGDYARVDPDDTVTSTAKRMQVGGVTEALVIDAGSPIGIVTERDILYKVVAKGLSPTSTKVRDIMSSPVKTIDEDSTVFEAITKMSKDGFRRLAVTSKGKVVGVVTQKAMVSDRLKGSVPLPELVSSGFVCPYCNSAFRSNEELSRHIDRAHLGGPGLLQGNVSKW